MIGGYYDPDGRPLELLEWAELFERRREDPDDSWWRIRTSVGEVEVSTVWIGIPALSYSDRPLIFETMIFGGDYDHTWRWASWDEARDGHARIVAALDRHDAPD